MSVVVLVNPNRVGSKFSLSPKDNCIVVEVDIPKASLIEKLVDKIWMTKDFDSGSKPVTVKANKVNNFIFHLFSRNFLFLSE